jgi:hypothetical protein
MLLSYKQYEKWYAALSFWMLKILFLPLATTLLVGKILIALPNASMPSIRLSPGVRVFCFHQLPRLILYMDV